jgi:hypothetical protein
MYIMIIFIAIIFFFFGVMLGYEKGRLSERQNPTRSGEYHD